MEGWILLVLLILGTPVLLLIWLVAKVVRAGNLIDELSRRVNQLEIGLVRLRKEEMKSAGESKPFTPPIPAPETAPEKVHPPAQPAPVTRPVIPEHLKPTIPTPLSPPPLPIGIAPTPSASTSSQPPKEVPRPVLPPPPKPVPQPAINWEQFMGVKMFSWLGGLALFFGVAFFVKYSFDQNWITPGLRVALGFLTGLGLLIGGVILHRRKQYIIGAQALCATGVLILYAVTYSCRSIYHFEFFGVVPTFLLMVLITTTAFFVAVRLNALVVAILGMLGGFLTPILISTGVDNPLGLFGYIAILDAGLLVVALNRRWLFLAALAAVGTVLMQIGWAGQFFEAEKYFEGNKILIAFAVLLGFHALYLGATWWAKRRGQMNSWFSGSALVLAAVALIFCAWFLSFPTLAARPLLLFGFVFLLDLGVTVLTRLDENLNVAQPLAGLAVFALLMFWTGNSLTNELLNAGLGCYFVFAVFHAAYPVILQRLRGIATPTWGAQVFPPFALVLVLIPIFKFSELSFAVWPFVFLVDLLAMGLALLTASLLPVLLVLLLTLAATGALIFKIPTTLEGMPFSFSLLAVFTLFFVVASVALVRKLKPEALKRGLNLGDDFANPDNLAALLPSFSAILPFLLLIMVTQRLPLTNPSPIFGLALLLVVLLLGLTRMFSLDWLPAVALMCTAALECAWHFSRFDPGQPQLALTWYLVFLVVFSLFPIVFLKKFREQIIPWAVAALVGLPQFFLIHRLVKAAYPNDVMGLLPLAFALPPLAMLVLVLKQIPVESRARLAQLAWLGGVALFFITLIFPIQFENQWLTIGWALEGVAVLWLFHRVPHPGLRLAGVGLLAAAFVRLACNPTILDYHVRGEHALLNWYLYSYGIVTASLFMGARLLAPPRNLISNVNCPPWLVTLGTVLAFLLMNLEIADYFTAPGQRVRIEFSGNFAQGMTYTIAWALFAFALIVIGIWRRLPAARYSALGLFCVTLFKLFFHDLAQLNQLYRIGAFIGVAVIAILASLAYQKFFAAVEPATTPSENPPANPPPA